LPPCSNWREAWRDRLQVRIFRRFRTPSTAISGPDAALALASAIALGDRELSGTQADFLAVLRLRQWHGLWTPVVDHALLGGPLGQLAPPEDIRGDELLDKVIAKANRIYPER
jgi:hypothetical protein